MTMTAKFDGRCKTCGGAIAAGSTILYARGDGARHATAADCARALPVPVKPTPVIDLKTIADFLHATVTRGLKSPKLRVLSADNRELRMSITRGGIEPGSIAVVLAGEFIGCVRKSGATTGRLAKDTAMQARLLTVATDPAKAAKEYAALMGVCSFCALPLTDAGSVEVGYGPICAKHWGLPHHPKGTPGLKPVPVRDPDDYVPEVLLGDAATAAGETVVMS